MANPEKISPKEARIRSITQMYYSNPKVQDAIFNFSKNREVVPRYFEGFGKRPDSLQYPGDVFELVKKGATSFHCSEEIWSNPLDIETGMSAEKLDELREGWDLLLDIDSKYLDYSKILAQLIVKLLKFHGIKNVGIKFSGSKGFHIIVPWKAFPEKVYEYQTKDMFPEWPRILTRYIIEMTREELTKKINELNYGDDNPIKKYIKREGGNITFEKAKSRVGNYLVDNRNYKKETSSKINELKNSKESWNDKVLPDLILVSPRHLFRMPYSLHEKTSLASIVLTPEELKNFEPTQARVPLKAEVRNFLPDANPGEAIELLREALDWDKNNPEQSKKSHGSSGKDYSNYKPVNLDELKNVKLSEKFFPPTIQKMLEGVQDGRKRAVFILLGFFRSIGLDRGELEKRIYDWNKKNKIPLKEGYIKAQLSWAYRNKPVPPPNFDKDYYKGLGLTPTPEELRYKNPSNFTVKKLMQENSNKKSRKKKSPGKKKKSN